MKFSKFLQTGLICLLIASSVGTALGQTTQSLLGDGHVDNYAITMVLKNKMSKDDLAYISANIDTKNEKTEAIYKNIGTFVNKHAVKDMKNIKKDIEKTLDELVIYKDVKISYKHAVPYEIIQQFKDNDGVKGNDSSVAYNLYSTTEKCDVSLKLASDNHGRLFESSELSHLSTQEVSKMSQIEINSVLKETVLHEASHCLMHSELQKSDFQLSFSDKVLAQAPEMTKIMNEKITMVKENLRNNKSNDSLDLIAFVNFNEGFADVMSAFARMGEKPTPSTIKEAKDQLLSVSHMREESGLTHKTQPAIQNALSKLDDASKMTINQRYDLAKEIASDSIIPIMKIVLGKAMGNSSSGSVAAFIVGGISVSDGKVNVDITQEMGNSYDAICEELQQVASKDFKLEQKMGTFGQQIQSYGELLTKYRAPEINTLLKATKSIMEIRNNSLINTKTATIKY